MEWLENCECLLEVGRQIREKATRRVQGQMESSPSLPQSESDLPLFKK